MSSKGLITNNNSLITKAQNRLYCEEQTKGHGGFEESTNCHGNFNAGEGQLGKEMAFYLIPNFSKIFLKKTKTILCLGFCFFFFG